MLLVEGSKGNVMEVYRNPLCRDRYMFVLTSGVFSTSG